MAPTYQEYMPLAFAIANSCGEEGRTRFHRICRISEKYHHDEADKLYGHALTKGTGRNSMGTVFHLAEVAGVKMDPKLANLQNLQSLHTHTRARVSYNAHPDGHYRIRAHVCGCGETASSASLQVSGPFSPRPPLPDGRRFPWNFCLFLWSGHVRTVCLLHRGGTFRICGRCGGTGCVLLLRNCWLWQRPAAYIPDMWGPH